MIEHSNSHHDLVSRLSFSLVAGYFPTQWSLQHSPSSMKGAAANLSDTLSQLNGNETETAFVL